MLVVGRQLVEDNQGKRLVGDNQVVEGKLPVVDKLPVVSNVPVVGNRVRE